ncbi:MAG: hypothetical protein HYY85_12100 [Deltaproteobacteria bacterium]|nr:hypothetical protein [Deltaproteobacteria bacterium]
MMMPWGWGMGDGWGFGIFGMVLGLVFWALLIAGIVLGIKWLLEQTASTFTGQIVDRAEFGKTWGPKA